MDYEYKTENNIYIKHTACKNNIACVGLCKYSNTCWCLLFYIYLSVHLYFSISLRIHMNRLPPWPDTKQVCQYWFCCFPQWKKQYAWSRKKKQQLETSWIIQNVVTLTQPMTLIKMFSWGFTWLQTSYSQFCSSTVSWKDVK